MIKFARFMQCFCAVFVVYDFGVGSYMGVNARWGWMLYQMANAAFMAFLWRVNGRQVERIESTRLHEELWQ